MRGAIIGVDMIYDDIINRLRRYTISVYAKNFGRQVYNSARYKLILYWLERIAFDDWVDEDSSC